MKNSNIALSLLYLLAISCSVNKLNVQDNRQVDMVFTASVENDSGTKTVLQSDRMSVWWSPRDSIQIYYGNGDSYSTGLFVSTNSEPAGRTSFRGSLEMVTGSIEEENNPAYFLAVYPSKAALPNPSHLSLLIKLPTEQEAADNTFAKGMFPAIARSENTSLSFYNVCGGIVFTVDGEGIKTVTLTGNDGEGVAGECPIDVSNGGIPEAHAERGFGSTSVTLKAPNGGTFTPGVRYFISVYPQSFEKGFTLTFFKASSKSEVTLSEPATIKRSRFLVIEHADSGAGEYEYAIPEEAYKDMDAVYESFALNIASHSGAAIYSPQRILLNLCGDDVYGAGATFEDNVFLGSLNEYRFDATNEVIGKLYSGYYTFIQSANSFISKYQDDIPEFLGAARVLRAYTYMMLAIGWGTPPWVDHVLRESEFPYNCDRDPDHSMTHAQLLDWCAQECEAAAQTLEERNSPQDVQGAYRVTKGFAQAIAGKAYLLAGNYDKAKTLLSAVINSGKYALVPGDKYWENFHIEGDGNAEKLFEPNLEYNTGINAWGGPIQRSTWMESLLLNWDSDHFIVAPHEIYIGRNNQGWGGLGVPQWFGDEFFANDGHSYRFDATLKHIDDAVYGMEYSNASISNMSLEEKKVSLSIGIMEFGLYGQSFWLPLKQLVRGADCTPGYGDSVRLNNYVIMRYAEVLLLYAEACLQTGDNATALSFINQIQTRAGSKTISSVADMDLLKREKAYELWFEGSRWADLVRWGDVDRVKQAGQNVTCLYDKLTRAPREGDENVIWENGTEENSRFYTVSTHKAKDRGDQIGYVDGKHNLFPYPASELEANPNLVQNPGW